MATIDDFELPDDILERINDGENIEISLDELLELARMQEEFIEYEAQEVEYTLDDSSYYKELDFND